MIPTINGETITVDFNRFDTDAYRVFLQCNPGDVILSPFAGIGSEGYQALKMGRKFIGIELKKSYYDQAIKFLNRVEIEPKQMELFG